MSQTQATSIGSPKITSQRNFISQPMRGSHKNPQLNPNQYERSNIHARTSEEHFYKGQYRNNEDEDVGIYFPDGLKYENQFEVESSQGELEEGLVFDIDGPNLSPIINTCISDNSLRQEKQGKYNQNAEKSKQRSKYYQQIQIQRQRQRQKQNIRRQNSPSWKQLINPDVDNYYNHLMSNYRHSNAITSKSKHHSECSDDQHRPNTIRTGGGASKTDQSRRLSNVQVKNQQIQSLRFDKAGEEEGEKQQYYEQGTEITNVLGSVGSNSISHGKNAKLNSNSMQRQQTIIQQWRKRYEDRISVLEHQNTNLKDELFYLRAAILAQYQAKQQAKSSSQKSFK